MMTDWRQGLVRLVVAGAFGTALALLISRSHAEVVAAIDGPLAFALAGQANRTCLVILRLGGYVMALHEHQRTEDQ